MALLHQRDPGFNRLHGVRSAFVISESVRHHEVLERTIDGGAPRR